MRVRLVPRRGNYALILDNFENNYSCGFGDARTEMSKSRFNTRGRVTFVRVESLAALNCKASSQTYTIQLTCSDGVKDVFSRLNSDHRDDGNNGAQTHKPHKQFRRSSLVLISNLDSSVTRSSISNR